MFPARYLVSIYVWVTNIYPTGQVKWWITLNEPSNVAMGYATNTTFAPAVNAGGAGHCMATHTMLLAHANAYRLYNDRFRKTQEGEVPVSACVFLKTLPQNYYYYHSLCFKTTGWKIELRFPACAGIALFDTAATPIQWIPGYSGQSVELIGRYRLPRRG